MSGMNVNSHALLGLRDIGLRNGWIARGDR